MKKTIRNLGLIFILITIFIVLYSSISLGFCAVCCQSNKCTTDDGCSPTTFCKDVEYAEYLNGTAYTCTKKECEEIACSESSPCPNDEPCINNKCLSIFNLCPASAPCALDICAPPYIQTGKDPGCSTLLKERGIGAHILERGACDPGKVCDTNCECTAEPVDADFDGYINQGAYDSLYLPLGSATKRSDPLLIDCDDKEGNIYPGATEVCNHKDDDCNGLIDEFKVVDPLTGSVIVDPTKSVCGKRIVVTDTILSDPYQAKDKSPGDNHVLCASSVKNDFANQDQAISCSAIHTQESEIGLHNYYTYACEKLNLGSASYEIPAVYCWLANKGSYTVCHVKELCETPQDDDCDGKLNYADQPDCIPPCNCQGTNYCTSGDGVLCDINTKRWCASGDIWSGANDPLYCVSCNDADSSCLGQICSAGQTSCNGGCIPGTCDVSTSMFCDSYGKWVTSSGGETFCGKCGAIAFNCGQSCTVGTCDSSSNAYCQAGGTWANENTAYCNNCGNKDPDCGTSCSASIFPDYCDKSSNKWCDGIIWQGNSDGTASAEYCNKCGSVDSDCGITTCITNSCDFYYDKWCNENGEWKSLNKDEYCARCKADNKGSIKCETCVQNSPGITNNKESSCHNSKDDDCNGFTDCNDPECRVTDPSCIELCFNEGAEQTCAGSFFVNTQISNGNSGSSCSVPNLGTSDPGCCYLATQECESGIWGLCTYAANDLPPTTEICNSLDDDCDGSIDEGCQCQSGETRVCGSNVGKCRQGVQSCANGFWGACFGSGYSTTGKEICDNGQDDNCNGKVDEECSCEEGANQSCGTDIGECEFGSQTCLNQTWGSCAGGIVAVAEICGDAKDNDCDGLTDDEDDLCPAPSAISATCYDGAQNQGEEKVDCGGPCAPCEQAKCDDRKKNGDEEGVDCGGPCEPCESSRKNVGEKARKGPKKDVDTDEDGLSDKVELEEYGTDPENPDTDEDTLKDEEDDMPLCPNKKCDSKWNEDSTNCPDDCGSKMMWIVLAIILILILLGGTGYILWKKGIITPDMLGKIIKVKKGSKKEEKKKEETQYFAQPAQKPAASKQKREYKTEEEQELEKSMKEAEGLFKG